jgi:hypothetical protein
MEKTPFLSFVQLASVLQSMSAGLLGAMHAAINLAAGLNAVTDDFAVTMRAGWCQHVNGAFKAIKGVSFSAA